MRLQNTSTDLWILVPTGVAINRLLRNDGNLMHTKRLKEFFGLSEKEIRTAFYMQRTEDTLFGLETEQAKKEQAIERIASLYAEKLHKIFKYVSMPLVMHNSRKTPIYHFVCASNSRTAVKIADDIIGKDQR